MCVWLCVCVGGRCGCLDGHVLTACIPRLEAWNFERSVSMGEHGYEQSVRCNRITTPHRTTGTHFYIWMTEEVIPTVWGQGTMKSAGFTPVQEQPDGGGKVRWRACSEGTWPWCRWRGGQGSQQDSHQHSSIWMARIRGLMCTCGMVWYGMAWYGIYIYLCMVLPSYTCGQW